jgi:GTP pyrophosphokinase
VIFVKLSDRMHNMRTLQYVSEEKQKNIAQETLDIYVPLASRLGINSVKSDLEDLCLRFLKPDIYYRLAEKVTMKKSEREQYIRDVIDTIHEKFSEYGLRGEIKGRPKHFYSIYKKMISRGVDFEQIQDILAFRVMVSNITECYKALGIIHSSFTPIPGRFKDYIAIPKVNNYQSLHTTVVGPKAERIEIQIRTGDMDEVAESGVAAHWKYKEGMIHDDRKLTWVQELLEYNQSEENSSEFMDSVKNDLDIGGVFVFTPKGDVRELRYGSTPLDFAYAVHTEVGSKCVGAKVNGKIVTIKHRLKSGDTIEILTSKNQTPSADWINIAKTSRAKNKIKQYLQKLERDASKELGREIFEKALKVFGSSIKRLKEMRELEKLCKEYHISGEDELLIQIGINKIKTKDLIDMVPEFTRSEAYKSFEEQATVKEEAPSENYSTTLKNLARTKSHKDNAVVVDGMYDVQVRMGKCCNPIPGDSIMALITKGRGITVHANNCSRVDRSDPKRFIRVEWNKDFNFGHSVSVRVITHDKPGVLSSISRAINNTGVNIRSAVARSLSDRKGSFMFEIEVKDYSELLKTISNIETLEEVISVERV